MKTKLFFLCPIPEEQKPIFQYLRFQPFAFWIVSNFPEWKIPKAKYFFFLVFFYLFFPSRWLLVFFFPLFFFFFSSFELKERLKQARLFYEESSWFSGQIWEKPLFFIKKDRLLSTQNVEIILPKIVFFVFFNSFVFLSIEKLSSFLLFF